MLHGSPPPAAPASGTSLVASSTRGAPDTEALCGVACAPPAYTCGANGGHYCNSCVAACHGTQLLPVCPEFASSSSSVAVSTASSLTVVSSSAPSADMCVSQCGVGCVAPSYACAQDGHLYCNSCVAACHGTQLLGQCPVTGSSSGGAQSSSRRACLPQSCGAVDGLGGVAPCGMRGDGCGGSLDCGPCAVGTCGGGGVPNQCGQAQNLCRISGGIWRPYACGSYHCGRSGACAAAIPGCDCGPGLTFVDGLGCATDVTCTSLDAGLSGTVGNCSTHSWWDGGISGTPVMSPGSDCITCHAQMNTPLAPYTVAGTVMNARNDSDDCNGVKVVGPDSGYPGNPDVVGLSLYFPGQLDPAQRTLQLYLSESGNFYSSNTGSVPYYPSIWIGDGAFSGPAHNDNGNCAVCHTASGAHGAKGRIIWQDWLADPPPANANYCANTGGTWVPFGCGDYRCGQANTCASVIPGCNCGPGLTFIEGVGCATDITCPDLDAGIRPRSCSTHTWWDGGTGASPLMSPGKDCILCHAQMDARLTPYTMAGTVMNARDDEDDCNGVNHVNVTTGFPQGESVGVALDFVFGGQAHLEFTPNGAGNFYSSEPVTGPYWPFLWISQGPTSVTGPMHNDDGNCAACHTSTGAHGALGRVVWP